MNEEMMMDDEQGEAPGQCIEINCLEDGTFSVSVEGQNPIPANDIKEALTAALELYKGLGATQSEDEFSQGFGQAAPAGAPPVERGMVE